MPPKKKKTKRSDNSMTPASSTEAESSLEPSANLPPDAYPLGTDVMCKHTNCFYVAKIIKVRVINGVVTYTIHYKGWNARYDETLTHEETKTRFQEHTDENVAAANKEKEELKMAVATTKKVDRKRATSKPAAERTTKSSSRPPVETRPVEPQMCIQFVPAPGVFVHNVESEPPEAEQRTTASEETEESSSQFELGPADAIIIPECLDRVLMDDCDMVTRQFKIPNLPARTTIDTIIADYFAYSERYKGHTYSRKDVEELVRDLMRHFNKILDLRVLYKYEFVQHMEILNQKRAKKGLDPVPNVEYRQITYQEKEHSDSNEEEYMPSSSRRPAKKKKTKVPVTHEAPEINFSDTYGFIHLLRFFYQYNGLIVSNTITEAIGPGVFEVINDILYFLGENHQKYFDVNLDYVNRPPEYQRLTFNN